MVHDDRQDTRHHHAASTAQGGADALFAGAADQCQGHRDGVQAGDDGSDVGVAPGKDGGHKDDKDCQAGEGQREDGLDPLAAAKHQNPQQEQADQQQDVVEAAEVAGLPGNVRVGIGFKDEELVPDADRQGTVVGEVVDGLADLDHLALSLAGEDFGLEGDDPLIVDGAANLPHIVAVVQNFHHAGDRFLQLHLVAEQLGLVDKEVIAHHQIQHRQQDDNQIKKRVAPRRLGKLYIQGLQRQNLLRRFFLLIHAKSLHFLSLLRLFYFCLLVYHNPSGLKRGGVHLPLGQTALRIGMRKGFGGQKKPFHEKDVKKL